MNWNNNDTKYILKRFIIYILIAFAMFIIGTWKTKALTTDSVSIGNSPSVVSATNSSVYQMNGRGANLNGWVYFTAISVPYNNAPTQPLKQVRINATNETWTCDIGNSVSYNDSNKQYITYSVKCPINTTTTGISSIIFDQFNNGMAVFLSNNMQFYSEDITGGSGQISQAYMDEFLRILRADLGTILTAINNNNSNTAIQNATTTITNQIQQQATQQHQDAQQINDSINNDNITASDADDFTSNQAFSDSTGLESVIQLPLNMVNSLTSTCQPIQVTIPFIDYTGQIPCMSTIYRSKFNALYTIVKIVINGFFVYRLLLKVYELVHNAKQPDEDKLEVIEL